MTYYCPECRHEVWDGPHGSKLAKCHHCGIAFDTMDIEDDDPRVTPPAYVVVENTPGYLPEEDDPYLTDDLNAAVTYMRERVEEYEDYIAEGGGEPATVSGPRFAYVTDTTREHDLGRNFSVDDYES